MVNIRLIFIATTGGIFVALCLFGAVAWSIYEVKAWAAKAELRKELEAGAVELRNELKARAEESRKQRAARAEELRKEQAARAVRNIAELHICQIKRLMGSYIRRSNRWPLQDKWPELLTAEAKRIVDIYSTSEGLKRSKRKLLSSAQKFTLTDPWGSPYYISYRAVEYKEECKDEDDEDGYGHWSCDIASSGPDRVKGNADDIVESIINVRDVLTSGPDFGGS